MYYLEVTLVMKQAETPPAFFISGTAVLKPIMIEADGANPKVKAVCSFF
jgi:hypothetical protein